MLKTIKIMLLILIIVSTLNSCKSESKKDLNEFINELNSAYGCNLKQDDFFIEKKENPIYHTMSGENSLLSLYSNKNGEIIQCTLSSFGTKFENNYIFMTAVGVILTNSSKNSIETMLKNAVNTGKDSKNGWTAIFVENDVGTTFIINQTTNEINNNLLPTIK